MKAFSQGFLIHVLAVMLSSSRKVETSGKEAGLTQSIQSLLKSGSDGTRTAMCVLIPL